MMSEQRGAYQADGVLLDGNIRNISMDMEDVPQHLLRDRHVDLLGDEAHMHLDCLILA